MLTLIRVLIHCFAQTILHPSQDHRLCSIRNTYFSIRSTRFYPRNTHFCACGKFNPQGRTWSQEQQVMLRTLEDDAD